MTYGRVWSVPEYEQLCNGTNDSFDNILRYSCGSSASPKTRRRGETILEAGAEQSCLCAR